MIKSDWTPLQQAVFISVAKRSPEGHESCAFDVADDLGTTEAHVQPALDTLVLWNFLRVAGDYKGEDTYQVEGITTHDALTYENLRKDLEENLRRRKANDTGVSQDVLLGLQVVLLEEVLKLSASYGFRGDGDQVAAFKVALEVANAVQRTSPLAVLAGEAQ